MRTEHALTTLPWAVVLSAVALFLAWRAYRHDRYAHAVRWGGWAAIVWAVWLVGLMRLAVRVGTAVADWAAGFVFRPTVWLGLVVGVVGVLLVVAGTALGRRGTAKQPRQVEQRRRSEPARGEPSEPAEDEEIADVEAILRRHGIE